MLVGYEANIIFRDGHELGEFGRTLVSRLASKHIADYRALLFASRIKKEFRSSFTSDANVSTYLPVGSSKLLPEAWIRYRLNPWLKGEKVKVFHGINEELPYHIGREVKTLITCYGLDKHRNTSIMDAVLWKKRMSYSFASSDAIVAVSKEVKQQLVDAGVMAEKIVVIGDSNPYEVTDKVVEQYYELYRHLAGEKY